MGTTALGDAGQLTYPLFVKPLVPKLFRALVQQSSADLLAETAGLPPETSLIWSEPTVFVAEMRAFAVDRQVAALAAYEGNVDDPAPARHFAERVLQALSFHGPLVLDIGLTDAGAWADRDQRSMGCGSERV